MTVLELPIAQRVEYWHLRIAQKEAEAEALLAEYSQAVTERRQRIEALINQVGAA